MFCRFAVLQIVCVRICPYMRAWYVSLAIMSDQRGLSAFRRTDVCIVLVLEVAPIVHAAPKSAGLQARVLPRLLPCHLVVLHAMFPFSLSWQVGATCYTYLCSLSCERCHAFIAGRLCVM